ncbi:hypothetical protein NQ317_007084 [Molorchus minor]|uniref:Equilibrative nucleoside transporter 3 n=1 Tax=Molorchus minor TaxID=1323400 RepID=A0ABQ9K6Y8_9CUCU|nr:hypothetical protein NQ317_007084 [Molorchus minor]
MRGSAFDKATAGLTMFSKTSFTPQRTVVLPYRLSSIKLYEGSHRVKMEAYNEISDVFNRVSIASIEKSEKYHQELPKKPAPKDTFYLIRVLSLLFGLLHILPSTFFITANNYWMYKLRDVSSETVDLNNKTTLQTYFNSGLMITQCTSMILCMLLSSAFAHTIKVRSRILSSLSIIAVLFVLFTALIKVNTDTWQTAFFLLSLLSVCIICDGHYVSGVLTLFQISTLALMPKFPPSYMKTFLMGQGAAGVFNGCLQVICLATGTSTKTSALFYFCSGTAIIFLALFMFFISKHLAFYQYYVEDNTVQMRKERLNKEEIKYVVKNIWFCIAISLIAEVNLLVIHASITGLVVSENYGMYFFVPTITYLYFAVISLFGRYVGAKTNITRSNAKWWVSLTVLRVVTVPLIMLCNAKPRSHLPVWFPHDWQYIIILGVLAFTHGFIFNMTFMSIPRLVPGKEEAAFLIMMTSFGIGGGLTSPLSLLSVRIL